MDPTRANRKRYMERSGDPEELIDWDEEAIDEDTEDPGDDVGTD